MPGAVEPNPTRLYQLVPKFSGAIAEDRGAESVRVEINELGLRERSLELIRRSQFRILAIGDSFTFGSGIRSEETWPAQLELALEPRFPSSAVSVINGGVPGYGLAQMRDFLEELLPEVSPRLVILGVYADGYDRLADPFATEDGLVLRSSEIRSVRRVDGGVLRSNMYRPVAIAFDHWLQSHFRFVALFLDTAYDLISKVRDRREPRPRKAGTAQSAPSENLRRGFEEIRRMHQHLDRIGVPLVVLAVAAFDDANRVYEAQLHSNEMLEQFCSEQHIPVFDPTEALAGSTESLRLRPSNSHWSSAADAAVGRSLASYLAAGGFTEELAREAQ